MNLASIRGIVTAKSARTVFQLKQHSPTILFVAGTLGVVTTTVLACRATLKLDGTLTNHEVTENLMRRRHSEGNLTDDQLDKELSRAKIKTALKIGKLYMPALAVGLPSIAALTGSHIILTKRNGVLMTAYAALDQAHRRYRGAVVEEYGAEADRKLALGVKDVEVVEHLSNGKTKTIVKPTVDTESLDSPYIHVFDEQSRMFSREPGRNADVISIKQSQANDKLRAKGFVSLAEVLDMLDLPRTPESFLIGWVWDPTKLDDEHQGDRFIDFGVFRGDPEWVEAFQYGDESVCVLDFNCDPGTLTDNMRRYKRKQKELAKA